MSRLCEPSDLCGGQTDRALAYPPSTAVSRYDCFMESDEIRAELAAVVDRLNELPDDAFAERWKLRIRQEELRGLAASEGLAKLMSSDRLKARIDQLTGAIEAHIGTRLSSSTAIQYGRGGGIEPRDVHRINRHIDDAAGVDKMREELRRLRRRLETLEESATDSG